MAEKENIRITLKCHSDTLTDTPQSAQQLMEEINLQNVLLYWQPAESLSVEQRIESLPNLAPWITNVHIFHWEDFYNRFPLADGFEEWKQYLAIIDKEALHNHHYLLEFVPDDEAKAFYESAEKLKKISRYFIIKKQIAERENVELNCILFFLSVKFVKILFYSE
ncbi:hypothetical protein AAK882_06985 [Carnobacteriaceae bacterium 52-44]